MEKMQLDKLKFEKQVEGLYKIYFGCILIGHLSVLRDFYEVTVQYSTFEVEKRFRAFLKGMIIMNLNTKAYLIEVERRNLPLRINMNLKPMPRSILYDDFKVIG